jgi:phosphatidylserine decarboxylase
LKLPIHPEGWPFIGIAAGLNLLLVLILGWWGLAFLPLSLWVVAFFRDPERAVPEAPGLIVCPADGRVLPIVEAEPPPELGLSGGPRPRIAIFMNVFDVHVNRIPCHGTVMALAYRPGKFFNASFDKASADNERMSIGLRVETPKGPGELAVVQIAGLVARRIVCGLGQGQTVRRGERFGIIRFGSRVEVFLPEGARVRVTAGQRVTAGESVLADFGV